MNSCSIGSLDDNSSRDHRLADVKLLLVIQASTLSLSRLGIEIDLQDLASS